MVKVEDKVESALRKMMGGDFTDVRPPISDGFLEYSYGRKMTSETYRKKKPLKANKKLKGLKNKLKVVKPSRGSSPQRRKDGSPSGKSPGRREPGSASKKSGSIGATSGKKNFKDSQV